MREKNHVKKNHVPIIIIIIYRELRRIFGHLQSAIVKKFDLGKETLDRHHQVARYTCVR